MPCSRIFFEQRAHLVAFSIGACILARSTFRLVVARRRAASIDKENAGQQAVLIGPEIIFALAYHIAPPSEEAVPPLPPSNRTTSFPVLMIVGAVDLMRADCA